MRRPRLRSLAGGAAGIAAGVIGGVVLTSVSAAVPAPVATAPAALDALHVPPVLTLRGEPIRLRYALICPPRDDGSPCDGSGIVSLRAGRAGPFTAYPLRRGEESKDGRYYVDVPRAIAAAPSGFSYFAVLRDNATGATVTVPSGGAQAPQVSVPLVGAVTVPLGEHAFGGVRPPDARAANAVWGSRPADVGLSGTRELGFTGPSSFDVEPDGTVDLLDSVNQRVLRFASGRRQIVPLDGDLRLADFAAEPSGVFDVVDLHGRLRRFAADGTPAWTQKLSDRTWVKLARGATVLAEPSEQWMPVAGNAGPLTRAAQADAAHTDKALANGRDILVDRVGTGELRLAEIGGGGPQRSWRIASATPLGEVQLVQSLGNGIVVVTHAYTDARDEFVVLVLDDGGLAQSFSLDSASWTETAPLARFRLAAGALYRLKTTQTGAVVDRFDLEVPQ
jgi:hypothetical protein